ncbi:Uncharacterised protein [Mycobacteroides abscessus]|nr:Uncharacterised protein [Mycobacteroides abscessus]
MPPWLCPTSTTSSSGSMPDRPIASSTARTLSARARWDSSSDMRS